MQQGVLWKWLLIIVVVVAAAFTFYKEGINLGLDLQGGVRVVLEPQATEHVKLDADTIKRTKDIVERRVNEMGLTEPVVQIQNNKLIVVELPGIKDPKQAIDTLVTTASLEFKDEAGNIVLTGNDLKDATASYDQYGNGEIHLKFNEEGTKKFAIATAQNIGRTIGIYLDNKPLTTPVVQSAIPNGEAVINNSGGGMPFDEASRIATLLRAGALPVPLKIAENRSVGASLGADSIESSKIAAMYGIAAIFVFMIVLYFASGVLANFTLILYSIIVMGILAAFHATLTLPGIFGLLLSVGMAVDANIIIFERVKDELRAGKTLRSAIDAGFGRAFWTVFDSNITTIIAAIVLYVFGTGTIKGFAITLGIGIVASMFTAITVTKLLLNAVVGAGIVKSPKLFGWSAE